jgi:replicative DNA helicase
MSYQHISVVARQALAEAELRTEYPEMAGLSTGVAAIDQHLRPVLEPGRVVLLGGASGRGKTALAAQLAVAFAHQVPVLLCSLEDDVVDASKRVIANLGRVSVTGLRAGFTAGHVPQAAYDAVGTLEHLPLYTKDTTGTVLDIGYEMARWTKQHGSKAGHIAGVVIIDQLSRLLPMYDVDQNTAAWLNGHGFPTPPPRGSRPDLVLGWQIDLLRAMARKAGLLVFVLTQLNRNGRDDEGRPTADSIKNAAAIFESADATIVPWRPTRIPNPDLVDDPFAPKTLPKTVPAPEDAAELICLKARSGPDGWVVPLRWDGSHQRFADPDEATADTYEAPIAPSPRALEGAAKFAALRAAFATSQTALTVHAPAALTEGDSNDNTGGNFDDTSI